MSLGRTTLQAAILTVTAALACATDGHMGMYNTKKRDDWSPEVPSPDDWSPDVPRPDGCVCLESYVPVCGVLDGEDEQTTYGNRCEAECTGALVLYEGKCEDDDGSTEPPTQGPAMGPGMPPSGVEPSMGPGIAPAMGPDGDPDCFCTAVYEPVCAVMDDVEMTFSNQCDADCAGAEVVYEGECGTQCICTKEYAPVCGRTEWGEEKTYSNLCFLECEKDAVFLYQGACHDEGNKKW